ncbi:MAG TPA: hypothetical protein VFR44_09800 [Actinomycetota bacterium]|nr:hypothetical protein [Actinomycetota bacterium]
MPETKQLLRETRDRIAPPPDVVGGLERRRRHKENVKRGAAAMVAIAVALVGVGGWFLLERDAAPRPADRPKDLGIFAPVAGRIVYVNEGNDLGYGPGLWAVDPSGPTDTAAGPSVANDVASTLVRLDLEGAIPLGWSSDGTELLFTRTDGDQLFPQQYLYVLHADGSETQLNDDPMYFGGAAISPDGSRVVFAVQAVHELGLYVIDAEGGQPARLPLPGAEGIVMAPTFSPDGTQIAYLDTGNRENHVWVMDADGGNAHEILANEATLLGLGSGLQWSPAGDRLAIESGGTDAIYTFAPDGSDFTKVIDAGISPYWSPDGSQIAYTVICYEQCQARGDTGGLAVADADGSNVREFGFAASGPWHPGAAVQRDETTPTPSDTFARANGEVLRYTGHGSYQSFGDLVAVNPETGEKRVLVQNLSNLISAEWSADGRWVAYSRFPLDSAGGEIQLWVVGASREPRLIATAGNGDLFADGSMGWVWSRTGAELLTARFSSLDGDAQTIDRSRLQMIDFATGETTDLGSIDGYADREPAWSPDGTHIAFKTKDGSVYSADLRSGRRSLLAHFPENDHDPAFAIDSIRWSPDGTHISVMADGARLYVMDADGSNLRLLTEGYGLLIPAWSPDGTRLAFAEGLPAEGVIHILVAPMDGSDPVEIGTVPFVGCVYHYECGLTWSPDASAIGFAKDKGDDAAIPADGSNAPEPIDDLTYLSWAGGRFGSH